MCLYYYDMSLLECVSHRLAMYICVIFGLQNLFTNRNYVILCEYLVNINYLHIKIKIINFVSIENQKN